MNPRAFRLGAVMVLLCNLVTVTLRSFAEAAFLESYGKGALPWLLIASASGFAVATLGYDAITRRAQTRTVDVGLLLALTGAAAVSPALLGAGMPPVILVIALAALSQVAGLALWNRVAASVAGRDARRMLPRAGAAVTAGGAIAGLGAGALVYRTGITSLPYVAAAVTVIVLALSRAQDRALVDGGAPGASAPAGTPEVLGEVQRRLLRGLIAVAVLEGIVATVIDLQFVAELKTRYQGDHLAVAVALFYGGTNAILLLLQVTAVPRLLVTRSLPTTAAIHPVLAIGWYAVFLAAPGFLAIAGTRTSDQVLRLATSRTSQEIELSALPPGPRARWKVLLRGAMWPAGAAAAAFVLLLVGAGVTTHPTRLAAAAGAIAVVWWIVGQITARRFQAALAAPLGIRAHRAEDVSRIDLATLDRWSELAGSEHARDAALARAALARARVDPGDLADHLRHDDAAVRAALFEQLARSPSPALRGELRASVEIEDDDRAFALGLKALAIAGDATLLPRGRSRASLSRAIAEAVQSAVCTLEGGDVAGELGLLCARDPGWAVALVRARRAELTDDVLATTLRIAAGVEARRAGALVVIAHVGPAAALPVLATALDAGDPEAITAIMSLDAAGAAELASTVAGEAFSAPARTAIARALAGAPAATALVATLLGDRDHEVAHAALRTALAVARGGTTLPAAPIAAALRDALAALIAHLDARDACAAWTACARHELDLATRRCVARLLWAVAVEAAAAGRDPATLAATARHLVGGRETDRRRALDVVQEIQAGRSEILAVIERWLRAPADLASTDAADAPWLAHLRAVDPWLASLGAGELASLEPLLVALRRPALFAMVDGPALAALAQSARVRSVDGALFAAGDPGSSMFVVTAGVLHATRPGAPTRTIEAGGVVGELAVLTHAPRAATVHTEGIAEVLEIDRATFGAASRRAPELVLGLSATLAGWLARDRPDVL